MVAVGAAEGRMQNISTHYGIIVLVHRTSLLSRSICSVKHEGRCCATVWIFNFTTVCQNTKPVLPLATHVVMEVAIATKASN